MVGAAVFHGLIIYCGGSSAGLCNIENPLHFFTLNTVTSIAEFNFLNFFNGLVTNFLNFPFLSDLKVSFVNPTLIKKILFY